MVEETVALRSRVETGGDCLWVLDNFKLRVNSRVFICITVEGKG